jgi:hypothetical protein
MLERFNTGKTKAHMVYRNGMLDSWGQKHNRDPCHSVTYNNMGDV